MATVQYSPIKVCAFELYEYIPPGCKAVKTSASIFEGFWNTELTTLQDQVYPDRSLCRNFREPNQ